MTVCWAAFREADLSGFGHVPSKPRTSRLGNANWWYVIAMRRCFTHIILLTGLLACFCTALRAQEHSSLGDLQIQVEDESGGFVPNAQIQILPSTDAGSKDLKTDADGKLFRVLPAGSYDLSVKQAGFRPVTKRIQVQAGARQTVEVVLKVQSCGPCNIVTDVLPVSFPEQSQAVSPDRRYVIVGVDHDVEPYHEVFLEDRMNKTGRKLFNYDRHVAILWAYDSKWFADTDYVGSDASRCSIMSVDEKVAPIPVLDVLFQQLSESARQILKKHLSNEHVYVEASVWSKPLDLMLKVSGHGNADPTGFAEFYNLLGTSWMQ